jgi:hypothetical protein
MTHAFHAFMSNFEVIAWSFVMGAAVATTFWKFNEACAESRRYEDDNRKRLGLPPVMR